MTILDDLAEQVRLVPNTTSPVFQALWRFDYARPGGGQYIRRSRAESALMLLTKAQLTYGYTATCYRFGECRVELHGGVGSGRADNIGDAISAALLEKERREKMQ